MSLCVVCVCFPCVWWTIEYLEFVFCLSVFHRLVSPFPHYILRFVGPIFIFLVFPWLLDEDIVTKYEYIYLYINDEINAKYQQYCLRLYLFVCFIYKFPPLGRKQRDVRAFYVLIISSVLTSIRVTLSVSFQRADAVSTDPKHWLLLDAFIYIYMYKKQKLSKYTAVISLCM